ncbi:hypothetical protein [Clavibacter sp. Sh2126]|uniref:hypothetical protein n=1 Tax=Clavibacter sp. Sh2126 TaxID=3397678 RepID=UPI0039E161B4
MAQTEAQIIRSLIEKWIPLGLEYTEGAEGVTTLFIHAGSELGAKRANVFLEQHGKVLYPGKLQGPGNKPGMVHQVQQLLLEDLREAERQFQEAGIACPTEYRITYEPGPGRRDVELSHELKYIHHPVKTLQHGPEDWLDGRLEKHYGKLIPPESEWPATRPARED